MSRDAKKVYETVCKALDARKWKYERHDEDLVVTCGARGEDLPMDLIIIVNPKAQVLSVISPMPFKIAEDKRGDAAVAVAIANYGFVNGTFDYDVFEGAIRFRIVSSFRETELSKELIDYMVMITAGTVDEYNDKFLMVSKGMLTVQQFAEWEKKKNEE